MRKLATLLVLLSFCVSAHAQKTVIDSIDRRIAAAKSDTQRINLGIARFKLLSSGNLDTAIAYGKHLLAAAKRVHYPNGEARTRITLAGDYSFSGNYAEAKNDLDTARDQLVKDKDTLQLAKLYDHYGTMNAMQNKFGTAHSWYHLGIVLLGLKKEWSEELGTLYQNNAIAYQQESDYPHALACYQQALQLALQVKDVEGTAYIYLNIGLTYNDLGESIRAEQSLLQAIAIAKKLDLKNVLAYAYANIASVYVDLKKPGMQYDYAIKAANLGSSIGDKGIEASSLSRASEALVSQKRFGEALLLSNRAISVADSSKQPYNIFQAYSGMGFLLKTENDYRRAIPFYEKAFGALSASDLYTQEVSYAYGYLSLCYEKTGSLAKALSTYKIAAKIIDSVRGKDNIKNATELRMNYEFAQKQQLEKTEQLEKDANAKRVKNQQYFLISVLGIIILAVIVIVVIQYRNNQQKQKAYELLQLTQAQLIQSAKMASLGELTAGIAHEIQNPLNFVNNFSEVSAEMIGELDEELAKGDVEEARAIAGDIRQNLQKINHHGKRADSIVKGMLEHSRTSGGEKQAVNINGLADEYLRLAYHGIRAKDKSFNAGLVTNFDSKLPMVKILPQDIGRVLINLFNNAFYAVNEKLKTVPGHYKPEVSVTTSNQNGYIQIKIADNGSGVPESIREKIMQPFFTTKPTGEGTGLGLSLSYDIVVKGHGGKIDVASNESGTVFTVSLPLA